MSAIYSYPPEVTTMYPKKNVGEVGSLKTGGLRQWLVLVLQQKKDFTEDKDLIVEFAYGNGFFDRLIFQCRPSFSATYKDGSPDKGIASRSICVLNEKQLESEPYNDGFEDFIVEVEDPSRECNGRFEYKWESRFQEGTRRISKEKKAVFDKIFKETYLQLFKKAQDEYKG